MLFPLGCLLGILRPLFSLVFGILLLVACLGFVVINSVRDNFLSSDFYVDTLAENDVYNRIYDEVLTDPEFEETTQDLMGDIEVPQQDIVGLAKQIIPPDYLQSQVEGAITGTIDYLNKETDEPEIYVDLGPPLDLVKPTLLDYIDGRIDAMEEEPVDTIEELEEKLEELYRTLEDGRIPTSVPSIDPDAMVERYVDEQLGQLKEVPVDTDEEFKEEVKGIYEALASGQFPTRIPSIGAIPISLRLSAYDLAIEAAGRDQTIPEETLDALRTREAEIKNQLRVGNVRGALEVATPELTGPVISEFVDDAYEDAFETLDGDPNFPQAALDGLDERSADIKDLLGQGDIKNALKVGVRALAGPVIDNAIDELKDKLDDQNRLDLIQKAAEQDNKSKEEFLDRYDIGRTLIDLFSKWGGWAAIVVIVVAALLMSAVQIPRMASALRYPGLALFFSGVLFLVASLVTRSQILSDPVNREGVSPIPPSLADIINDVATSMAADVGAGFITFSIVILVVGFGLALMSFFVRMLHIPFLSK